MKHDDDEIRIYIVVITSSIERTKMAQRILKKFQTEELTIASVTFMLYKIGTRLLKSGPDKFPCGWSLTQAQNVQSAYFTFCSRFKDAQGKVHFISASVLTIGIPAKSLQLNYSTPFIHHMTHACC